MSKLLSAASLSVVFLLGSMLAGCAQQKSTSSSTTPDTPSAESSTTSPTGQEKSSESTTAANSGTSQFENVLAELSPEDRALAEKQKICPVSGAQLGKMGKPYKVTVEGRDVLLCCPACEAKIKADPQKYLAKLDKE